MRIELEQLLKNHAGEFITDKDSGDSRAITLRKALEFALVFAESDDPEDRVLFYELAKMLFGVDAIAFTEPEVETVEEAVKLYYAKNTIMLGSVLDVLRNSE